MENWKEEKEYQRVLAAARNEEPDQVPVEFWPDGSYLCAFAGIREREYYLDWRKMLKAQMLFRDTFSKKGNFTVINPVPRPDFGVCIEASAFGCKMKWPADSSPWVFPIIKDPEDVDKLEVPDPEHDGLMPFVIEYYNYMREEVPKEIFVGAPIIRGPINLASQLRGMEPFFEDLHLDPELTHKMCKISTEGVIEILKLLEDLIGKEDFHYVVCDDISGFLSLKHFEEFALPYLQKVFKKFDHPLNMFHNDADTQQLLDAIPKTGAHCFNFGPPETCDLKIAKEKIGDKICLVGNIPPYEVLQTRTPSEVEQYCKEQIEIAGRGGGYVLSPGGVVNRGTSNENIFAMIRAAEKHGKYPL